MGLAEFFSCALLAFGAPFAMFCLTIATDPVRIIIMIAAAFGWLLSMLLSSIIWTAVVPLRGYLSFGLVFSIIFQELLRYGVYRLLRRAEQGLKEITDNEANSDADDLQSLAYVSGFGFGIMSGAFALSNVLADAAGPGTVGLRSGSEMFFFTSSLLTLCMILLHTFWSVVFFSGLTEKNQLKVGWVVGSHFLVSSLTLLNKWELYVASILPAYVVLVVTIIIAFRSVGGSYNTLVQSLSSK